MESCLQKFRQLNELLVFKSYTSKVPDVNANHDNFSSLLRNFCFLLPEFVCNLSNDFVRIVDELLLERQGLPDLVRVLPHQEVPVQFPVNVVAHQTSLKERNGY